MDEMHKKNESVKIDKGSNYISISLSMIKVFEKKISKKVKTSIDQIKSIGPSPEKEKELLDNIDQDLIETIMNCMLSVCTAIFQYMIKIFQGYNLDHEFIKQKLLNRLNESLVPEKTEKDSQNGL